MPLSHLEEAAEEAQSPILAYSHRASLAELCFVSKKLAMSFMKWLGVVARQLSVPYCRHNSSCYCFNAWQWPVVTDGANLQ